MSLNSKRLEGKVAVITGGASGIGEATVRLFVKHGAKVVIADIQDDLGHSLCQELASSSQQTVCYVHCDVTSDPDVRNAVDTAVTKYGQLDIMFNNAGIAGPETSILTSDNQDFKNEMNVNVFGCFLGAKHAARVMIPAKKGCIIFNASTATEAPDGATHAYVASKHAVVGLMKNLCVELGADGIRVNSISPYGVATPMIKKGLGPILGGSDQFEELISSTAFLKGAVLKAEDVAEAVLYLAGDESKYVSGLNLLVDGGYSVTNPLFSMEIRRRLSTNN